jgi:hypothetical protein
MTADDEEYAYQALPPGSIRIVNLYPRKGDEVLQCDIQIVYLDNLPSYEALSYVWGNPMPSRRLQFGNMMSSIYTHAQHVIAWVGEDHLEETIVARGFILELVKKDRKFFTGLHEMNDEFLAEHG